MLQSIHSHGFEAARALYQNTKRQPVTIDGDAGKSKRPEANLTTSQVKAYEQTLTYGPFPRGKASTSTTGNQPSHGTKTQAQENIHQTFQAQSHQSEALRSQTPHSTRVNAGSTSNINLFNAVANYSTAAKPNIDTYA